MKPTQIPKLVCSSKMRAVLGTRSQRRTRLGLPALVVHRLVCKDCGDPCQSQICPACLIKNGAALMERSVQIRQRIAALKEKLK